MKIAMRGRKGQGKLCLEDDSVTFRLAIRIGIFEERSGTKSYKSLDKQADDKVRVHIF
jgi:hypothetical protein